MTSIGATGHQDLPTTVLSYVTTELTDLLETHADDLEGACSLAAGADQLFARLLLQAGGRLRAVIPCEQYPATLTGADRDSYDRLLSHATWVETLPFEEPSEEAFLAAGRRVVDLSEIVIAIWDGEPAGGRGGTGDIVRYAVKVDRELEIIWPPNASR